MRDRDGDATVLSTAAIVACVLAVSCEGADARVLWSLLAFVLFVAAGIATPAGGG